MEVRLPRDKSAPSRARRCLEELYASTLDSAELATAKLLASELVNNALVHGQGQITLRGDLDEDRLVVEVIDEGTGLEQLVREREFERVRGFGLRILDSAASRWGLHEGTNHAWFELERSGPRLGPPEHEN